MKFAIFEDCLQPEQEFSYYFSDPIAEVVIYQGSDFAAGLVEIEQLRKSGLYLAGYIAYTATDALYDKLRLSVDNEQPLLHFVAYKTAQKFASQNLEQLYPEILHNNSKWSFNYFELKSNYVEYLTKFNQVQQHLIAGNSYQLNLTLPLDLSTNHSDLFAIYYQLSRSHPVAYSSYLPFAPQSLISISPELFFKKNVNQIFVRPMKGTMPRGATESEDLANAEFLAQDAKNRAENLIIADLLRNDLAKFCVGSSVKASDLFAIEKFQSLFQMTSKIQAEVPTTISFAEIISGLFPCGSITGAPKLRTMQLIEQIEGYSRGAYSGAIGYILPNNDMQFSVAIRTLSADNKKPQQFKLGVGGGITVKSDPVEEWAEIGTKLSFIRRFYRPSFNLIESFLVSDGIIVNLADHLQRLNNSAQKLGFKCMPTKIQLNLIDYVVKYCKPNERSKLRLELNFAGEVKIEHVAIGENPDLLRVAIHHAAIDTQHGLFLHKTDSSLTRGLYTQIDQKYKPRSVDELIFVNQNGFVTESRYHNLIIDYNGTLITPPVAHGLLPGIYRQKMLGIGNLTEQDITPAMITRARTVYLCNDVRGLIKCQLLVNEVNDVINN